MNPLELPPMDAIRRNHALEHATINVLTEKYPALRLVGRSDWEGFTLYGTVDTDTVKQAITNAWQRLVAGEKQLAIHPRCGTNVATGVVLTSLVSYITLGNRKRSPLGKLLQMLIGLAAVLTLVQPLGVKLQELVTTSPDVSKLRVVDIRCQKQGNLVVHRIKIVQEQS
ncbi:MAG: DUF6391 domain-containing protein [Anaerolineae bacterium]